MKNTNNKFWLARSAEAKTPRVSSSFSSPSFDTTSISKISKLSSRSHSISTTFSRRGAGPIDVDEVDDTWNSDDDELHSPGWVSPVSVETGNKADPRKNHSNNLTAGHLTTGPVDLDEDLSLSVDESFLLQDRTTSILQIEHHDDVEDHIIGWKSSVDSPEPRGVSENISIEAIHNNSAANFGGEHQTMVVQTLSSIRRNISQPKKVIPKLQRCKRDTPNIKTPYSTKRHNIPNPEQSIPPIQMIDTATTTDEESLHLVMPPVMKRIENGSDIRDLSGHTRDKKSTSSFVSDDDVANNEEEDDDVSQVWELRSGSVEWQSILHKTGLADRLGSNYEGDYSSTSRSTKRVPQDAQTPESVAVSKPNIKPGKNAVAERVDLQNRSDPSGSEGDENNTDEPVGRLGIQEMPSRPDGLPKTKKNTNAPSPVVQASSQPVCPGLRTYPNAAYVSDSEDERGSFDDVQAPSTPTQNNTGVASSFLKRLTACVSPITPAEPEKYNNNKAKNLSKESPRSSIMKFSLPALCGRPDNVYDETSEFTNTEASVQVVTSPSELEYKRLKDSFVGKTRANPTPPRERTLYRSNSNNKYDVQITPSRTVSSTSSRDVTPSRDGQGRSSNISSTRKFIPVGVVPVPKADSSDRIALKVGTSGSSPMTRSNSTSTTNSSSGSLGNSPHRVPSDDRKNKAGKEEIIIAENFDSVHFFQ